MGHASAHNSYEDVMGITGSTDADSLTYKLTNTSSSNPGHKHTLANGATDVTASAAELNYVDGVTSAIQTQMDLKAPLTSPTLVTPVLGVATATSINKVTITAPTTSATLTLVTGSSLITAGAYAITLTSTGTTGVTLPTTGTLATLAGTETFTNKTITRRVGSTTSSATPTINTDNVDIYRLTAQAADITSFTTNLSGTPVEGQMLLIEITGTAARAITWGASFEASTVALPTTTVTTAMLQVLFKWNSVTSKWRCLASV